jgi:hypothetical protein
MLTDTGRPRPHRQNPNAQLYPKNLNHLKAARKALLNPAPAHHKQLPFTIRDRPTLLSELALHRHN